MPHVFELFDPGKYVAAHELGGKDVIVTIDRVVGAVVEGEGSRKNKRPVIYFKNASKPMVLNKTNSKIIINLYGGDYTKWGGRRITLWATTTSMAGTTVPCIRVRPKAPGTAVPDSPPILDEQAPQTAEGETA